MIPILDKNNVPLMPCSEGRARILINSGRAIKYYQKGIQCIKLIGEPSARNYQEVVLGIDPGSKREGYTVLTKKAVVLNITSNTPDWIREKMETRRDLRKSRRQRKTPYRKMRLNRSVSKQKGRLPPSTKARWNAKLRIIKLLKRILLISSINIEDFSSRTFKRKLPVNQTIAIMQNGKNYFYEEIKKLGIELCISKGFSTHQHRIARGFPKLTGKDKLSYKWEAHNVDSHCLAEMVLNNVEVKPDKRIHIITFLEHKRRQLHKQIPTKKNIRRRDGGTVSLGLSKGSVAIWKNKMGYIGGYSDKKGISIHEIKTSHLKMDNRFTRNAKKEDIKILYYTRFLISKVCKKK